MEWWRKSRANEFFNRGVALSQSGAHPAAERQLAKALRTYQRRHQTYETQNGIARTYWRLSLVKSANGRLVEAIVDGLNAVQLWERLHSADSANDLTLIRELTRCCTDLAMIELTVGQLSGTVLDKFEGTFSSGVKHAERAVELGELLVRKGNPEGQTELGTALHNVAVAYQKTGAPDKGARAVAKAVKIRQQLSDVSDHPSLADWECANSLLLSGTLYLDSGQAKFAATALVRAAELAGSIGPAGADLTHRIVQEMLRLNKKHPGILKGREIHIYTQGM